MPVLSVAAANIRGNSTPPPMTNHIPHHVAGRPPLREFTPSQCNAVSQRNPTQSHCAPVRRSRRSPPPWYRIPSSTPRCCHGVELEVSFRDSLVRQTAVPWQPTHVSRP